MSPLRLSKTQRLTITITGQAITKQTFICCSREGKEVQHTTAEGNLVLSATTAMCLPFNNAIPFLGIDFEDTLEKIGNDIQTAYSI